jgi:hypothetical protein
MTCEAGVSINLGREPQVNVGRRCKAREAGGSLIQASRFEAAHGKIMRLLDLLSCHPQGLRPAIHAVARFAGWDFSSQSSWDLRPRL